MPEPVEQPYDPSAMLNKFLQPQPAASAPSAAAPAAAAAPATSAAVSAAAGGVNPTDAEQKAIEAAAAARAARTKLAPAVPAPAPAAALPPANAPIEGVPTDVMPAPPAVPDASDLEGAPAEVKTNEKARSAWTGIKRDNKTLQATVTSRDQEIARLKADLEAAKTIKPAEMEEFAALKHTVEEQEATLQRVSLENSAAFKARYDNKVRRQQEWISGLLQRAGQPEPEAKALAAKLTDPATGVNEIDNLLSGVTNSQSLMGQLANSAFQAVQIQQQRAQALADAKATSAVLQEEQSRTSVAELSKVIVEGTAKMVPRLVAERSWAYAESQDPQWNTQRDQLVAAARLVLRENKPDEIIKHVMEGQAAAVYRRVAESENARANALQAELDKRMRSRPRVGAGAIDEPVVDTPPAVPPKPMDLDARLAQHLKQR